VLLAATHYSITARDGHPVMPRSARLPMCGCVATPAQPLLGVVGLSQ
jgi:hypothetical protein